MSKRVFLIVLDSYGVGALPDAAQFGDEDANTLYTVSKEPAFRADNLKKLGLFHIDGLDWASPVGNPIGSYGKCNEQSKGKDTTTGHWEIAGAISRQPMPTYPNGFPNEIIDAFSKATGRGVLCNRPYSGTEVIQVYGDEHVRTGNLIVYTSADSVFQIAAHEDVVPLEELYEDCKIARDLLKGEHAVGRVIARPFIGTSGNYTRTPHRHDYSLTPPVTLLNVMKEAGLDVISVGKISDIFAGSGITESIPTEGNTHGLSVTSSLQERDFHGLCFVNLVDFDMLYGHRRDPAGYAKATAEFDGFLGDFLPRMGSEDILIITADHGCDPAYPKHTDHTREYIPLLWYQPGCHPCNLHIRETYADIGKTIADLFELPNDLAGTSFREEVTK